MNTEQFIRNAAARSGLAQLDIFHNTKEPAA